MPKTKAAMMQEMAKTKAMVMLERAKNKALVRENAVGKVYKRPRESNSEEVSKKSRKDDSDDEITFKDSKAKDNGNNVEVVIDDDEDDLVLEALPPDRCQLRTYVRKLPHVRNLKGDMEKVGEEDKIKMVERLLRDREDKEVVEERLLKEDTVTDIDNRATITLLEESPEEQDLILKEYSKAHDISSDYYMATLKGRFDFWVNPQEMAEQPAKKKSRRDLKPRYKA